MNASPISFLTMLIASSALLMVVPAIASDYTLDIFGNANMDDTIDEDDIAYVEGIIDGTNDATELADANYDGQIDEADIAQIELIIHGVETELTLIDSADRIVTVKIPIGSIVVMNNEPAEMIRALGSEDKITGVSKGIVDDIIFFSEFSDLPNVGTGSSPDYEKIISIMPDILIYYAFWPTYVEALEENLGSMGITVVCLDCFYPQTMTEDVKKLSYIIGKNNEAEVFIGWYEGYVNMIASRTERLSEDEKPRVYLEGYNDWGTCSHGSPDDAICTMAGGINIAEDLVGSTYSEYPSIDPEWVIEQNPDVIVREVSSTGASSGYDEDDPSEMKALRETVVSRPGLAGVTAIINDDVFLLSSDISREPEFIVATAYLAKYLHPNLFEDLDPQAIHQEYLTRFQGLDYDLDDHGVFVYPPLEEC
jgi:iron complex transport system substrate-binding protein